MVGGDTVLVEPRGRTDRRPTHRARVLRNFEASNTIALEDSSGRVVIQRTVLSNDWTSTWGYFEATLDLPPLAEREPCGSGPRAPGTEPSMA